MALIVAALVLFTQDSRRDELGVCWMWRTRHWPVDWKPECMCPPVGPCWGDKWK
jgi:hypothetical protein